MDFTLLDAGLVVVFAVFFIRGLLCGLVQELAGLIGIFLGFFAASRFQHKALPYVSRFIGNKDWAEIASYVVVFIVAFSVIVIVGMIIRNLMKSSLTSWLDYAAGAVVGAIKGAIACTIIFLVVRGIMPHADFIRDSIFAPYLAQMALLLKPYLPSLP